MNIDRRQLALPVLAFGLLIPALGVNPAFAGADEDAVAKNVEAFRAAQFAADAKTLEGLCAAELSYSHSDGRVEDKATFITNATDPNVIVWDDPALFSHIHAIPQTGPFFAGDECSPSVGQKSLAVSQHICRIATCFCPSFISE